MNTSIGMYFQCTVLLYRRGYENVKSITRDACYASIIFIIFFFIIIIEHKLRIIILPYKKQKTTLHIMEYGSYLYSINYGWFVSVFFIYTLIADVPMNVAAVIIFLDSISFLASYW